VSSIASSKKAPVCGECANANLARFCLDRSQFELTDDRSSAVVRFHFSQLTEAEFVVLVCRKKGTKRLAGRRRTIGKAFVEKNSGHWGPIWRDTRKEHSRLQSA
jgi:hypothetical protein